MLLSSTINGEGFVETQNGKGQTLVEFGAYQGGGLIMTANDKGEPTSVTPDNPTP